MITDALTENQVEDLIIYLERKVTQIALKIKVLKIHSRLYKDPEHRQQETIYNGVYNSNGLPVQPEQANGKIYSISV